KGGASAPEVAAVELEASGAIYPRQESPTALAGSTLPTRQTAIPARLLRLLSARRRRRRSAYPRSHHPGSHGLHVLQHPIHVVDHRVPHIDVAPPPIH